MATEAQITANRLNAQKSTGPRTDEGKEASSQNAFKHGLFVNKAVIRDESQEEYDRHREALLAEWNPIGQMEAIVTERLVNLTWRLERAQRMQNQSIEYLGLRQLDSVTGSNIKTLYRRANEQSWDEPDVASDHLLLGRLATRDWSYARVLDRMLLYERRIENSMYKTMGELKKLQKSRIAEQARASRGRPARDLGPHSETDADAAEDQSAPAAPLGRKNSSDLKKQSQLSAGEIGIRVPAVKDYDDESALGQPENKANQSQSKVRRRACPPVGSEIAAPLRGSQ